MRIFGGRLILIVGIATAAGCAGAGGWAKEGSDEAQVRADLASCRTIARNVTQRDRQIDFDIQAARGADRGINADSELLGDVREFTVERRSEDLVSRCMRSRGYNRDGGTAGG